MTRWVNSQSEAYWANIIDELLVEGTYEAGEDEARAFVATAPSSLVQSGSNSPRLLITAPDGRVLFDSSKSDSVNNFASSKLTLPSVTSTSSGGVVTSVTVVNPIGENHNTRAAIMTSLLMQPSGLGYQTYYSTTTKTDQSYVAKRIGSQSNPVGVVRVSANIE